MIFYTLLYDYASAHFGNKYDHGFFPKSSGNLACDAVVMHKNVMIELINSNPLQEVVDRLRSSLVRGGVLLFDYPELSENQEDGKYLHLLTSRLGDESTIEYGYTPFSCGDVEGKCAEICLKRKYQNGDVRKSYTEIEFRAIPLDDVCAAFSRWGFKLKVKTDCSIPTFYPAKMNIVVMERV